ncbi:MAG TPA: hypothetical protein VK438_19745 [Xanthobacteraceae bacterium]|nr:hypothetical protein [Xanthobacteraceae bacterium]
MTSFLDALVRAAEGAEQAEAAFRRDVAARAKALEQERAFAYRRLNFMRAIAAAIAAAENEEVAVASAREVMRERLGWASESQARGEVLTHFATVARAAFVSLAPPEAEAEEADVGAALVNFEAWYAATHPQPFWVLFETYMPETPRVDF